jgi:hypothetical protein
MTTPGTDPVATTKGNGLMKSLINSMWGFWLLLLAFSLGLAASVYFIWLKGNI